MEQNYDERFKKSVLGLRFVSLRFPIRNRNRRSPRCWTIFHKRVHRYSLIKFPDAFRTINFEFRWIIVHFCANTFKMFSSRKVTRSISPYRAFSLRNVITLFEIVTMTLWDTIFHTNLLRKAKLVYNPEQLDTNKPD